MYRLANYHSALVLLGRLLDFLRGLRLPAPPGTTWPNICLANDNRIQDAYDAMKQAEQDYLHSP